MITLNLKVKELNFTLFDTSSPVVGVHIGFGISAFFVCLLIVILGMINAIRSGKI